VLLFRKDALNFNPDWAPAKPVQLGESMGI
ncbi:MAG: phosphatidylserine decarboxylase, partial [Betaproteobacteria bacterium]|nr:phosphatidylserine decarboxylase [Betaproteobacteria bacterium]